MFLLSFEIPWSLRDRRARVTRARMFYSARLFGIAPLHAGAKGFPPPQQPRRAAASPARSRRLRGAKAVWRVKSAGRRWHARLLRARHRASHVAHDSPPPAWAGAGRLHVRRAIVDGLGVARRQPPAPRPPRRHLAAAEVIRLPLRCRLSVAVARGGAGKPSLAVRSKTS